jgi:VWFA-related protein
MQLGRLVIVLCAVLGATTGARQDAQQPTFRSRVTVVPVDVRVVDRQGRPVEGLKETDFTVLEDGVPQRIVHFMYNRLEAAPAAAVDEPLGFRRPLGEAVAAQNHRIFLIVLGRGRHTGPVRAVEGAIRFIRERLLPQDRVAITAYNRSTDFTTDHARVIQTLERYQERREEIESRLEMRFSGLAATYGGSEIPPTIQAEIDAIFRGPGALPSRTVEANAIGDGGGIAADDRRFRDRIMDAELARQRIGAGSASPFDASIAASAATTPESFDDYTRKSLETRTDLANLYAGVRYLRWVDGEKHLVFISHSGLYLPRLEHAQSLASLASDARVSIDIIHTAGTPAFSMAGGRGMIMADSLGLAFMSSNSSEIAALTGGQMTSTRRGNEFFDRLDRSTRAQYLIGYSPTNGTWDGKYRRIEIKVNRRDVRVLYRTGYAGRQETRPLDRAQYLMYTRVAGAANLGRPLEDLAITLDKPAVSGDGKVLEVVARIQPGALKLTAADGQHVGKLETVSLCADRSRQIVGELWHTVDLKLSGDKYESYIRDGMTLTLKLPLRGEARYLKTIVYDYGADLVGSAMIEIRKK